jgi:uncharacterized protein
MTYKEPDTTEIQAILNGVHTIAIVGASDKPDRPSFGVMHFLQENGYRTIPVNPRLAGQKILGEEVFATLADISQPVDMVDIFRNSEEAGNVVDEAIAIGARIVWMQLDVINRQAAERATAAGLKVVMNRCPKIELSRSN